MFTYRRKYELTRNRQIVPALMFHSVGLDKWPWAWNHISESLQSFEAKISLLRQKGFTGVFWSELYDHMAGHRVLPDDSILLTFDDGYLDNWVYVYPILKKYGMKGTVFVSPDFVDPSPDARHNFDDVMAGRCSLADLQVAGFLSWAEMREMERSGLMDIQSHAMTHTWYFSGPRIVDFHSPHKVTPHPWLFWNARPDRKPFYLTEDQQQYVPWGQPILEHGKSLETKCFVPDEVAMREFADYVAAHGGQEYFLRPDWRSALENVAKSRFNSREIPGAYESEEVRRSRLLDELGNSKLLIEKNLNKKVDFICWPGGAYDETIQELAAKVGFKSWTLGSRTQHSKRNFPGANPAGIKRMGTSNRVDVRGRRLGTGGAKFQLWNVFAHQGSAYHRLGIRAYKLGLMLLRLGRIGN